MPTVRTLGTRKDGKPAGYAPGSPKWRAAGRDASKMERKAEEPPVELPALDTSSPEALVKAAAPEAIEAIRQIMRRPGRNAATQLRAAEALMRYGVQEPPKAQTVSAPGGGPVGIQGDITITLVPAKDGRRAE